MKIKAYMTPQKKRSGFFDEKIIIEKYDQDPFMKDSSRIMS